MQRTDARISLVTSTGDSNSIVVQQDTIQQILKLLDPQGVDQLRRAHRLGCVLNHEPIEKYNMITCVCAVIRLTMESEAMMLLKKKIYIFSTL